MVLVGDLDPDEAEAVVRSTFGGWVSHGRPLPRTLPRGCPRQARLIGWALRSRSGCRSRGRCPIPAPPPEVLRVLEARSAARLPRPAGSEPGPVPARRGARPWSPVLRPPSTRASRTGPEAVRKLLARGVIAEDVRATARQAWVSELFELEDPARQAEVLADAWSRGDPPGEAWAWRSRIRSVKAEDVTALRVPCSGAGSSRSDRVRPTRAPERQIERDPVSTDVDRDCHSAFYQRRARDPGPGGSARLAHRRD